MSGKRRQFRFIIEPRNFHKTETMIHKAGLPTEITVFSRSINISHLCGTQVCQIERTVFLQQFGKLHRNRFVFLPLQINREPTDHVLSHIQDILSIGTFKNGNRFQRFLYADIRILLRSQFTRRSFHHIGSLPCTIIETIRVPTFHLEAGIIFFTIKLVICDDRAFRSNFPRRITGDRLLRPVCIFDLELCKQTGQTECFHSRVTHREETAIPQNHPQRILVGSHQSCYIIYIIIYTFIIQGRHRGKHILAYFLSVQVSLIRAKAGNIQDSPCHCLIRRKLFTQISSGQTCFIVSTGHTYLLSRIGKGIFTNPSRFPFRTIEQRHRPSAGITPRSIPLISRQFHTPIVRFPRFQSFSGIRNQYRFVRTDHARIPPKPVTGLQLFRRSGHLYLIGSLFQIRLAGSYLPGKTGLHHIDSQWIFFHLQPEVLHFDSRIGRTSRPSQDQSDQKQ